MGWQQVTSDAQGGQMLSTMTMETNSLTSTEMDASTVPPQNLLFKREVGLFLFQRIFSIVRFVFIAVIQDSDY